MHRTTRQTHVVPPKQRDSRRRDRADRAWCCCCCARSAMQHRRRGFVGGAVSTPSAAPYIGSTTEHGVRAHTAVFLLAGVDVETVPTATDRKWFRCVVCLLYIRRVYTTCVANRIMCTQPLCGLVLWCRVALRALLFGASWHTLCRRLVLGGGTPVQTVAACGGPASMRSTMWQLGCNVRTRRL